MWYTVYRLYDKAGKLLYVGCTSDITTRLVTHRREREWGRRIHRAETESYNTKREALKREGQLVTEMKPEYNIRVSTGESMGEPGAGIVQVIIRVPESMKRQIRMEAAEENRSMNQVINSALKFYFNSPKGQGPK